MPVKKKPTKKHSKTPEIPAKKRKYVFKTPKAEKEKGVSNSTRAIEVEPIEEDGVKMFAIEKFTGTLYRSGFEMTKEYKMLEALIRKMNPKEGFIIKAEWKRYPHIVVKTNELKIQLRVLKIPTMENFVRVVRVQ